MDILKSLALTLIIMAYFPVLIILPFEVAFHTRSFGGRIWDAVKKIAIFMVKVALLVAILFPLLSWIMLFSLIRYHDYSRVLKDIQSIKEPESIELEDLEVLIPVGYIAFRDDNHRYKWNGRDWEDLGELPPN